MSIKINNDTKYNTQNKTRIHEPTPKEGKKGGKNSERKRGKGRENPFLTAEYHITAIKEMMEFKTTI